VIEDILCNKIAINQDSLRIISITLVDEVRCHGLIVL